jgi:hypothetical protein
MAKHSWRELLGTLRGLLQATPTGTPTYHQPSDPVLQAGVVLVDDVVEELNQLESTKNTSSHQVSLLRAQVERIANGSARPVNPWEISGMKKLTRRERKIIKAFQDEITWRNESLESEANHTLRGLPR